MTTTNLRWQKVLGVMVILVMVAASFSIQSNVASAKPAPVYKTLTGNAQAPVGYAVSQPLSALAEKMDKSETIVDGTEDGVVREFAGGQQIPRQVVRNTFNLPGRDADRPVIEPKAKVIDPPAPGLDWQWAGVSQGVNRAWYGYGVYPPDTQGDISEYHYIQVVNIQMAIWDLWNVSAVGTPYTLFVGPINILWQGSGLTACEASADGDPVVVFDEYADRWVLSQFALPNYPAGPFYECVAVSATNDPMGVWYLYEYSFPVMNDYPKFGVWHDGYYMTINQFDPASSPAWRGQGVVVFDRATMLVGGAAPMIYIDTYAACTSTEPECYLGGMLPTDADGSTAPTGNQVFMQFDDDAWGYSVDQLQLWEFVPDWGLSTATFTHLVDLPTTAFDSEVCPGYARNCLAQSGTTAGLDAISDRLMYRLQWRDFGSYQAMVVNHTVDVINASSAVKGQAGIRWYELRDTGSGWGIYQQGDVAPDTKNRWMGSAAMDGMGNIALGYSVTDATMYPGIRYTVHLVTDPLGTMRAETTMVSGAGAQTGTGYRWGDYSMMSVYPEGFFDSGCDFVYTTEYLRGTTPAEWYTWLGWFHNASCYSGDVVVPDTLISSTGTASPTTTTAEFTFSGTDDVLVASYECSFDGSAFAACTSPKSYTGLVDGPHTFEVRAVDSSANVDPTPASYSWTISIPKTVATFVSQAANDGFIVESSEFSGIGGLANSLGGFYYQGDFFADKQVKAFLSFDTTAIPTGAIITEARIEMRYQGTVGTNPFTTHGPLMVDIANPYFGTGVALAAGDFQAASSASNVFACATVPVASWYTCNMASSFGLINEAGTTQFRLQFTLDDNDDLGADFLRFYSGNYGTAAYRPVLVVTYYVP